jgi:hypothetical protein
VRRSLTALKKVFESDIFAVVVEKEGLSPEGVMGEDVEYNGVEAEEVGATQSLLYPPAPRLAIFFSACAIASDRESGVSHPGAVVSACASKCT